MGTQAEELLKYSKLKIYDGNYFIYGIYREIGANSNKLDHTQNKYKYVFDLS